MEIRLYEEWMKPQVHQLFSKQYGRTEEEVATTMEQFYEHPFQKDKCIRLVAMDEDKVAGFQSLFYWPYQKNGKLYHSFQSGNSLVHADYRGKGIFQQLLRYLDDYNKKLNIDFLMGFPVQMSYGSFMKCKWDNPLNIVWYVRFLNPFAFLSGLKKVKAVFDDEPLSIKQNTPENTYRLCRDAAFENWIMSSRDRSPYCYFHYQEGDAEVRFSLKLHQRNRWFNELIIGDVQTTIHDVRIIKKAFRKLARKAFFSFSVTALSIAINEQAPGGVTTAVKRTGFIRTDKSIYFITKNYCAETDVDNPQSWELYRSDVDTW